MKRVLSLFMAFFLSICMITPVCAFAEERNFGELSVEEKLNYLWNKLCNDVEYTIKNTEGGTATQEDLDRLKSELASEVSGNVSGSIATESENGIKNFFNSQKVTSSNPDTNAEKSVTQTVSTLKTANENIWAIIAAAFSGQNYPELGLTFDLASYIDDTSHKGNNGKSLFNIFRIIGYSLVLVFFSANLIETTIKYEIFTFRGFVSIFGRLVVAKFMIDMSGRICLAISDLATQICVDILGAELTNLAFYTPTIDLPTSDIWLIGPIIDYVVATMIQGPVGLIMLTVLITSILILIKLLLRSFEMTMLITVSPAFFACFSSEVTKQYFRNFILTFIQVAAQIVFMAVVYYVGTSQITGFGYAPDNSIDTFAEVGTWTLKVIPNTIVMIAMAIMMVRPPRVLTNLIR